MKPCQLIFTLILCALVAFVAAFVPLKFGGTNNGVTTPQKETRLEAIKRTGVLRCGYVIWPPYFTKDANTGQFGGPFYELAEEIGRQLKLKIEWTGEVAMGQMTDLSMNRFDMICAPVLETPARAREGAFTLPIFYSPFNLYVRTDDKRFDNNLESANRPEVKLAGLEGGYSSIAADESFPKAQKMTLPQLSGWADLYMTVATKKADAAVSDPFTFARFNANNPGMLHATEGLPVGVLALGMPIPANEPALKDMIDTTLAYLQNSGFTGRLLDKYEGAAKSLRPARPYQE